MYFQNILTDKSNSMFTDLLYDKPRSLSLKTVIQTIKIFIEKNIITSKECFRLRSN